MRRLLLEAAQGGHMAHPFELPNLIKTGGDLLDFFQSKVNQYFREHPSNIGLKLDGTNVSFKLVQRKTADGDTVREFAMDRGSQKEIDVSGITIDRLKERFPKPGHGMVPDGTILLRTLNSALKSGTITDELETLGMWNDPSVFINTEFVNETRTGGKPVNVVKYGQDYIAFHGVNRRVPSPNPKSNARVPKEVVLTKSKFSALASLANKLNSFSPDSFGVYSPENTRAYRKENVDISYDRELAESVRIGTEPGKPPIVKTLGSWLRSPEMKNPYGQVIKLRKDKNYKQPTATAQSKFIYTKLLIENAPLSDVVDPSDPQGNWAAINGAIFTHATLLLGKAVMRTLTTNIGSKEFFTMEGEQTHEGIVMIDKDIFGTPQRIKVTGDFIVTGVGGAIAGLSKDTGAKVSKRLGLEIPDGSRYDRIALVPGGFKPPHKGHYNMVESFSKKVGSNGHVFIFMGHGADKNKRMIRGKEVDFGVAAKIWKTYIVKGGLNNVSLIEAKVVSESERVNPMHMAYEMLEEAEPGQVVFMGAGEEDAARFKNIAAGYLPQTEPPVQLNVDPFPNVIHPVSNERLRATNLRAYIERDNFEEFSYFMPDHIRGTDAAQNIYVALGGNLRKQPEPEPEPEPEEEPTVVPPPISLGEMIEGMVTQLLLEAESLPDRVRKQFDEPEEVEDAAEDLSDLGDYMGFVAQSQEEKEQKKAAEAATESEYEQEQEEEEEKNRKLASLAVTGDEPEAPIQQESTSVGAIQGTAATGKRGKKRKTSWNFDAEKENEKERKASRLKSPKKTKNENIELVDEVLHYLLKNIGSGNGNVKP